jgi:hypothetical protein
MAFIGKYFSRNIVKVLDKARLDYPIRIPVINLMVYNEYGELEPVFIPGNGKLFRHVDGELVSG